MIGKKKYALGLVVIGLCLIVIWKFKILNITSVEIKSYNTPCFDPANLKQQLALEGINILLIKEDTITRVTKQYYCIKSFTLMRRYPNKIILILESRLPLVRVAKLPADLTLATLEATASTQAALINWSFPKQVEETYLVADNTGYIFTSTGSSNLSLSFIPEVELKLGLQLAKDKFSALELIFLKLNQLGFDISNLSVKLETIDEYVVIKTGQLGLVFSFAKDISKQLASLQLILQKAKIDGKVIEILDLRFERPVVIYGKR